MTFEEALLSEFEKIAGVEPGSLTQQLTSQHDKIPPLVLARLMRDREDSMTDVQNQFNDLFSKKGGIDQNATADMGKYDANRQDEYDLASREDVMSNAMERSNALKSDWDPAKSIAEGGAPPVTPIAPATGSSLGGGTQTPMSNDNMPLTSVGPNQPSNKSTGSGMGTTKVNYKPSAGSV